jgi:hypothetical protein
VEKVGMQGIAKHIFHLMLIVMVSFGGLCVKDLGEKFISMGCSFQGFFRLSLKMP